MKTEDSRPGIDRPLRGLVLARFGRDAELLRASLGDCGVEAACVGGIHDIAEAIHRDGVDTLVVTDDAFVNGGDDQLLAALNGRIAAAIDIIPLVILTSTTELAHPLTRFPGVVVIAKPTRRAILDSVLRGVIDIRERVLTLQAMTAELQGRNVSLADALRVKDRFVATMSHELRTPLNGVLSYADLLHLEISGSLNDTQHRYVDRILASARHLLDLIGEVLDFAKLNASQLSVDITSLDIVEAVDGAVDLVASSLVDKGIKLTIARPAEPLPLALGDHLRVRQILLNLLSNAIKFTPAGEVTIRFDRTRFDSISVEVADTGIGIPAEKLSGLFQDFYQVESELTRTRDGAGLGLAISKRLALLMGGNISVASRVGEGSIFAFTLPLAVPAERVAAEASVA